MAFLNWKSFIDLYVSLCKYSSDSICSFLIFCANTVDALCAYKILSGLLSVDFVTFKVNFVQDYSELFKNFESQHENFDVVIFLDCGSTVDLSKLTNQKPHLKIYIFDSHRPVSLLNIFANDQVILLLDDFEENQIENYKILYQNFLAGTNSNILNDYYHGTWYGTPSTLLLYRICYVMNRGNMDYIWSCIVGITDAYLSNNLTNVFYNNLVLELNDQIMKNQKNSPDDLSGALIAEKDSKLVLLKHWNLYSSMLFSKYLFRLPNDFALNDESIESILAKMGIPLQQSKCEFSFMDLEYRETFFIQASRYIKELDKISFDSFSRDYNFSTKISASDVIYAIHSFMLECDNPSALGSCALSCLNSFSCVKQGISKAIWFNEYLLEECSLIIRHKKIRIGKSIRYLIYNPRIESQHFYSVHFLKKLGYLLIEATLNRMKSNTPLLVAMHTHQRYRVVACYINLHGPNDAYITTKEYFGKLYRKAATDSNAKIKHDFFDPAIIEVDENNFKAFMTALQKIDKLNIF